MALVEMVVVILISVKINRLKKYSCKILYQLLINLIKNRWMEYYASLEEKTNSNRIIFNRVCFRLLFIFCSLQSKWKSFSCDWAQTCI